MIRQAGFTLIELLVVIGIIGILATVLLTQIGTAQQSATEFECASNLKNIAGGIQSYKLDHQNDYPKGGGRKFLHSVWRGLEKSDQNRRMFFCPEVRAVMDGDDPDFDLKGDPAEFWKQYDDIPSDYMSYAARASKYRKGMNRASEALVADANLGGSNHKTGNMNVLYGDYSVKKILKVDLEDSGDWPMDDPDFYLVVGEGATHKDLKKLTVE